MLLQIHEPGQTPMPHEDDTSRVAIGIDLGTTHSLIAWAKDNDVHVIRDDKGNALLPSVVAYEENTPVVGQVDAKHAIASVKRLMGRGYKDVKKISGLYPYPLVETQGQVRLALEGGEKTPVEISADILISLKKRAEAALQTDVTEAVITVPAYFDDAQRQATKDAAMLAGIKVLRLVNEPTAAALAYGLDQTNEGVYAIYDLGGGTFDVSILKMEKGVFQVLATGGSTAIGGDDFDREIAEIMLWDYKHQTGKATPDNVDMGQVLREARRVKELLSQETTAQGHICIDGVDVTSAIHRDQINQVMEPYVDATVELTKQALQDANLHASEVQGVVMVGGSTRVPLVAEKIEEFFGEAPLMDVNPDEVVATGAALQASGLVHGSGNLLLDVIPLSLGLETMGGLVEKIIHRNTPIPVAKAQEFTTYQDGQTAMKIHVVQGERETVSQNRSLAEFTLKNIPPMTAGAARIKVMFTVDADGLLTVSAVEETTKTEQHIEVKPSYGLDDKAIEQMLRDSMIHAKDDVHTRLLQEAKVDAKRVMLAVEAALKKDESLLSDAQKQAIYTSIDAVKQTLDGDDRMQVKHAKERLEQQTEEFASMRMDKYITLALEGKHVDEL